MIVSQRPLAMGVRRLDAVQAKIPQCHPCHPIPPRLPICPCGVKPTYLAQHGHTVINPKLLDEDFDETVRLAQAEFDKHQPQIVVGSSRGGALEMNIERCDAAQRRTGWSGSEAQHCDPAQSGRRSGSDCQERGVGPRLAERR